MPCWSTNARICCRQRLGQAVVHAEPISFFIEWLVAK